MTFFLKWLVAILLGLAVVVILVAPSVDLPATTLRGVLSAAAIAGMLQLLASLFCGVLPRRAVVEFASRVLQVNPLSLTGPPVASLRC
jgi:hypothetical protein